MPREISAERNIKHKTNNFSFKLLRLKIKNKTKTAITTGKYLAINTDTISTTGETPANTWIPSKSMAFKDI